MPPGEFGGGGTGLDFYAVIQAALVGAVLFAAAVAAVRRAASRYFVVDAAGFAAAYDDHHHLPDHPEYAMPPQEGNHQQRQPPQQPVTPPGLAPELGPCARCGGASTKRCSGCKRLRYCSGECQSKHWQSDHKNNCKQMKLLDTVDKSPCGVEANSKKSSVFGRISLVPGHRKLNKVIFPYDEFLRLYDWNDRNYDNMWGPGLVNCGNSCFANVVLQCLSYTRPLVAYLLGKDHTRQCSIKDESWCFLCELQSHIQRAIDSAHPFAPMNILSHLPNIGGNLGIGRQEDAHEFMRFAIDKMQSACLDEFGGEKVVDLSAQETTVIQHIFGGRLQSQVHCTACGVVSNRYENMMDLTVEIHGDAESLEECLDQFTAVEWLDGDNKYRCDGCNDYVKARKRLTVHQAPNILTVTLKRFQSGRFGKLNKKVTFPTKLDLTPYMSTTDGTDQYNLYAVVVHLDMLNASFFGHYICYIKSRRGHWLRLDDCKVMFVDEEEVHAQGAYMLLYSRRTARPGPLLAVKEPIKQEKQCEVLPSNGKNHLISEDVPVKCESFFKPSEDLRADSESCNESVHRMDTLDQLSDLDSRIDIEREIFITNENLHQPVPSALHVLKEDTQDPCSLLEGSTTMRSDQVGNSACESSSVNSSAEECEEPAPCIDSVDYIDIDTEAGREVERQNVQQQPVLGDSVGGIPNKTSVSTSESCMAGKAKPLFSLGFLDKPTRKKSPSREESQNGRDMDVSPQKTNGHWSGHLSRSEQGVIANSSGGLTSYANGNVHSNGDMFANPSNGVLVNGDAQFGNYSLDASKRDVPLFHGFNPRPHTSPSSSKTNQNNTSNCEGDMSFFQRGFLERPRSREKAVKGNDGLQYSNGNGKPSSSSVNGKPSSSSVNGNRISDTSSSPQNGKGGMGMSPGFLTKRCRESAAMGDPCNGNTSKEQERVSSTALPDQIQERWSSDCSTVGIAPQHREAFIDNVSCHGGENGHAVLCTNNAIYGVSNGTLDPHVSSWQMDDYVNGHFDENGHAVPGSKSVFFGAENGSDGPLDASSCQMDDVPATLVSANGMGSKDAVDVVKSSMRAEPVNDGLRRRLTTSKYFDAQ